MKTKTIGLAGAVEAFELHDTLGNTCAAAMFKFGADTLELYLWDFNDSIPTRTIGEIGAIKSKMDAFFHSKLAAGFVQPTVQEHRATIN